MDGSTYSLARGGRLTADPFALIDAAQRRQRWVLASMAELVARPDAIDAADTARLILDYLVHELPGYFDDEVALVEMLERIVEESAAPPVADTVREGHAVMRQLLPPVTDGLRALHADPVTAAPDPFTVACTILREIIRMHASYVDAILLPLARERADAGALAALADDIAARRLLAVPPAGGDSAEIRAPRWPGRTWAEDDAWN